MTLHNSDFDIEEDEEEQQYTNDISTYLDERQQQDIQNLYNTGQIPNFNKYGNGDKSSKRQSDKEETPKEVYSQKYSGSDYLSEAVLIGSKPYFAVSTKLSDITDFPSIVYLNLYHWMKILF